MFADDTPCHPARRGSDQPVDQGSSFRSDRAPSPFPDRVVRPARRYSPQRLRRSVSERLAEALFALAGGHGAVLIHRETPWASITFSGSRHHLVLSFAGIEAIEPGERFIAALPDHEFNLPGQLVAEAQLVEVEHVLLPQPTMRVSVELLLLDDEG